MTSPKKGPAFFDRYLLGILIALEIFMSFTIFGYIHLEPISITLSYIPVVIAAAIFGPLEAMLLGLVFGLASMFKASASYISTVDALFSPFESGAPLKSLFLAIGGRALFGLAIGYALSWAKKLPSPKIWLALVAGAAPKLHSLLLYTIMGWLFPGSGYGFASSFKWSLGDFLIALLCAMLACASYAFYHSDAVTQARNYIDNSRNNPYISRHTSLLFAAFELVILLFAVSSAVYFSDRVSHMLAKHGIAVSASLAGDMLILQLQFLFALLALNLISIILLIAIYKYMAFREYKGEIDGLTGIMGRRMFLYYCEKIQQAGGGKGWFILVDADHFKAINDSLGHATGDLVLKAIAGNLQKMVSGSGQAGRLGGDEFAAIIEKPLTQTELKQKLHSFLTQIAGTLPDRVVSCSIGAFEFVFPKSLTFLLTETDAVLYKAKEKGRACFVLKSAA